MSIEFSPNRPSQLLQTLAALAVLVTGSGCAVRVRPVSAFHPALAASPTSSLSAEIYGRASNSFPEAVLFKPAEGSNIDLTFRLAPWILQEITDTKQDTDPGQDRIGSLPPVGDIPEADHSLPRVHAQTDSVSVNGRDHLRLTYLWCYGAGPSALPAAIQGVRITLNTAGEPSVWEVLTEASGMALIFVSESVESAARAQYGAPLPGRRFAVERGLSQAPKVVVARAIDDGPMPMGPLVYLRAGTRSVGTLTCRCMPAQAKRLATSQVYRLAPVRRFVEDPAWVMVLASAQDRLAFQPEGEPGESRLERCLRLPAGF